MTGILRKTISYPFKAANKLWKVAWYKGGNSEHQLMVLQDLYSRQRQLEEELQKESKPDVKELGTQNFLEKLVAKNASQNASKRQELMNIRRQVNKLSKYMINSNELEMQRVGGGKFTPIRAATNLGLHATQKTLYHLSNLLVRGNTKIGRIDQLQEKLGNLSDFRRNALSIFKELKKTQEKQGNLQYAASLALKTQELKEALNEILDKKRRELTLQPT